MSKIDFEAFKEKFDLSDNLINTINIFFEKLLTYGYISTSQKNKLIRKLYENINEIYIGTNSTYDYKTGFYDANQKILYIKDENDIPAVYLRLLYVIATTELGISEYISGYRVTKLATDSYKLTFKNYGLNRAVMANLVCKLCDGLPTNIKITSGFKTYTHNFFGYSIDAPNDIYAIEGKLLSQFCFALNIDEELLYTGIFSNNPDKYLQSILNRKKIKSDSEFFVLLDKISRFYSTYNKLAYLSKKLDENYLEIKKHALDKNLDSFMLEKESIEKEIQKVLSKLKNTNDEDNAFDENQNLELNLNEVLTEFENNIKLLITQIQDILAKVIVEDKNKSSKYEFASRLKQFDNMLIVENDLVSKTLSDVIIFDLLPKNERSALNIMLKIKYSIIQNILAKDSFTSISKLFSFNVIPSLIDEEKGCAIICLKANREFARLVQVNDLNLPIEKMRVEPDFVPIDNLSYLLHSDYSNMYVGPIEKIYSNLKDAFEEYKDVDLKDIYIFEYNQKKYVLCASEKNTSLLSIVYDKDVYRFEKLEITESYSIFGNEKITLSYISKLPAIYNK